MELTPDMQVKVTQIISLRDRQWTIEVAGSVVEYAQKPTGSWFAHSKADKLWLDRLTLRKPDGELVVLNLDGFSRVEPI